MCLNSVASYTINVYVDLFCLLHVALEKEYYKHDDNKERVPPDNTFDEHKHTSTKGIQGYKNSCYLDATLYGMFMFSDAFDVLLKGNSTTNTEELHLQNILKREIVYPLRKLVKHDVHTIPTHICL